MLVKLSIGSRDRHDKSHGFHPTWTSDHDDCTSDTKLENPNLVGLWSKWRTLSHYIVVLQSYWDAFSRSACMQLSWSCPWNADKRSSCNILDDCEVAPFGGQGRRPPFTRQHLQTPALSNHHHICPLPKYPTHYGILFTTRFTFRLPSHYKPAGYHLVDLWEIDDLADVLTILYRLQRTVGDDFPAGFSATRVLQ